MTTDKTDHNEMCSDGAEKGDGTLHSCDCGAKGKAVEKPKTPLAELFEKTRGAVDEASEEERRRCTGKALIAIFHGEPFVLCWQAGEAMREQVSADGGGGDSFSPKRGSVGCEEKPDGLYVGVLKFERLGKSDWEDGSYEYGTEISNLRPATKEEWKSHLDGEWPWEDFA